MALTLSFLNSLHGGDPKNEGDLIYNNNTGELKAQINDTLESIDFTTTTASNYSTCATTGVLPQPASWHPVADTNAGNVTLEVNENGHYQYNVEYTYTSNTYPMPDDTVWHTDAFKVNNYSLFDNDFIYINENGEIFIDDERETNATKIGMALLKAIDSKNSKTINSIEDLE